MTKVIPTWGYAPGQSRIFDLSPGQPLPEGWHDSPAKIPVSEPGKGGAPAVAASHPPPQASPPPPSIDAAEMEELRRLLAEERAKNARLTGIVARLEAQVAGAVPAEKPHPETPDPEPDLPMPKVIAEAERKAPGGKKK